MTSLALNYFSELETFDLEYSNPPSNVAEGYSPRNERTVWQDFSVLCEYFGYSESKIAEILSKIFRVRVIIYKTHLILFGRFTSSDIKEAFRINVRIRNRNVYSPSARSSKKYTERGESCKEA